MFLSTDQQFKSTSWRVRTRTNLYITGFLKKWGSYPETFVYCILISAQQISKCILFIYFKTELL